MGARGGRGGGAAKVILEPHRHPGVFVAKVRSRPLPSRPRTYSPACTTRARSTSSSPATSFPETRSTARSASPSNPLPPTPTSPPRRSSTASGTPSAPSWPPVSSVDSTTSTLPPERRSSTSEPPVEPLSLTSLMSSDPCVLVALDESGRGADDWMDCRREPFTPSSSPTDLVAT